MVGGDWGCSFEGPSSHQLKNRTPFLVNFDSNHIKVIILEIDILTMYRPGISAFLGSHLAKVCFVVYLLLTHFRQSWLISWTANETKRSSTGSYGLRSLSIPCLFLRNALLRIGLLVFSDLSHEVKGP